MNIRLMTGTPKWAVDLVAANESAIEKGIRGFMSKPENENIIAVKLNVACTVSGTTVKQVAEYPDVEKATAPSFNGRYLSGDDEFLVSHIGPEQLRKAPAASKKSSTSKKSGRK